MRKTHPVFTSLDGADVSGCVVKPRVDPSGTRSTQTRYARPSTSCEQSGCFPPLWSLHKLRHLRALTAPTDQHHDRDTGGNEHEDAQDDQSFGAVLGHSRNGRWNPCSEHRTHLQVTSSSPREGQRRVERPAPPGPVAPTRSRGRGADETCRDDHVTLRFEALKAGAGSGSRSRSLCSGSVGG